MNSIGNILFSCKFRIVSCSSLISWYIFSIVSNLGCASRIAIPSFKSISCCRSCSRTLSSSHFRIYFFRCRADISLSRCNTVINGYICVESPVYNKVKTAFWQCYSFTWFNSLTIAISPGICSCPITCINCVFYIVSAWKSFNSNRSALIISIII